MKYQQERPPTGRNCRSIPARNARRTVGAKPSAANVRSERRLPLFAQFPPASLFKAIHRAVSRRAVMREAASGTGLANSRLWRAAGGP